MATLFLTVGLPAAGKTTRARELERDGALRLTTDEWVHPLFGPSNPPDRRDALEGRLLWTALQVVHRGLDVVLDFGCWSRDERSAVRTLTEAAGGSYRLLFFDVDVPTQHARVHERWSERPHETFAMTEVELVSWRAAFQPPDATELAAGPVPEPPAPHGTWADWAADRWPGFVEPRWIG
jgi:predicted kinase